MKNFIKNFCLIVLAVCALSSGNNVSKATSSETNYSLTQSTYENTSILSKQENDALISLADNCDLSYDKLKSIVSFKASNKRCCLVPICNCTEHKDCLLQIFSYSNPSYMKYYLKGNLLSSNYVEGWFSRSANNIKRKFPNSITFLIKVEDKVVGRIGLGPLSNRRGVDAEIGYAIMQEYSGQGIMSKAVDTVLNFLQYLRDCNNSHYNFTRLRATAKFNNVASNSILLSRGFIKSKSPVNDGYGVENEYFYYFNV